MRRETQLHTKSPVTALRSCKNPMDEVLTTSGAIGMDLPQHDGQLPVLFCGQHLRQSGGRGTVPPWRARDRASLHSGRVCDLRGRLTYVYIHSYEVRSTYLLNRYLYSITYLPRYLSQAVRWTRVPTFRPRLTHSWARFEIIATPGTSRKLSNHRP